MSSSRAFVFPILWSNPDERGAFTCWLFGGQDVTANAIQGVNDLSDAAKKLQDYVDQPGLYRHLSVDAAVQAMQHQRIGGAAEALNKYVGPILESRAHAKKARTAAKAKATRAKNAAARANATGKTTP